MTLDLPSKELPQGEAPIPMPGWSVVVPLEYDAPEHPGLVKALVVRIGEIMFPMATPPQDGCVVYYVPQRISIFGNEPRSTLIRNYDLIHQGDIVAWE